MKTAKVDGQAIESGAEVEVGKTIEYTITIANTGNVATSFTETDTFTVDEAHPAIDMTSDSTYVTYDKTTGTITATALPKGATAHLTGSYTVQATDNDIANAVTGGNEVVVEVEDNPAAKVTKTADKTSDLKAGDVVTYTITVENVGNVALENVIVTDTMDNGGKVTWEQGTTLGADGNPIIAKIEKGKSETLKATYTVTQADVDAQKAIKNRAVAKDVPGEPGEVPVTPEEKDARLKVNKVTTNTPANGTAYTRGEVITYTITATNEGNVTLSNITVVDELTGGSWAIASLAPGATSTEFATSYTVTPADEQAGSVLNVATATGDDPQGEDPKVDPGTKSDPTAVTYLLTINYVDANGNAMSAPYMVRLVEGATYNVNSPVIDGYTASASSLSGAMPGRDLTLTVTYTAIPTPTPVPPAPTPTPTPTPAAFVPPAAPAVVTPTPDAPAVTPIADNPTPQAQTIEDDGNALGDGGAWSLFDLICTIVATILSIIMLIFALGRNRKDGDDEETAAAKTANGEEVEEDEVYKRKRIGRILSIIPAVGAIVLFILTQDLTQPMTFFDNWSLVFGIIGIINIVLAIVTRKKTDDGSDEEQQQTPQSGFVPAGPASL